MTTSTPTTSSADAGTVLKPRYTVHANKDTYVVRVEVPGVSKDGIKVDLDQGVLTIEARRKPAAPESWKALHRELSHFDYALRLKVNAPVEDAKLSAKLEDGILILSLPLKEAAKPRLIPVQ